MVDPRGHVPAVWWTQDFDGKGRCVVYRGHGMMTPVIRSCISIGWQKAGGGTCQNGSFLLSECISERRSLGAAWARTAISAIPNQVHTSNFFLAELQAVGDQACERRSIYIMTSPWGTAYALLLNCPHSYPAHRHHDLSPLSSIPVPRHFPSVLGQPRASADLSATWDLPYIGMRISS